MTRISAGALRAVTMAMRTGENSTPNGRRSCRRASLRSRTA
jgi:hypothetical protein